MWRLITGYPRERALQQLAFVAPPSDEAFGFFEAGNHPTDRDQKLPQLPNPRPSGIPSDVVIFAMRPEEADAELRLTPGCQYIGVLPEDDNAAEGLYRLDDVIHVVERSIAETESAAFDSLKESINQQLIGLQPLRPYDLAPRATDLPAGVIIVECPVAVNGSQHKRQFVIASDMNADVASGTVATGRNLAIETYVASYHAPEKAHERLNTITTWVLGSEAAFAFLLAGAGWATGSFGSLVSAAPVKYVIALALLAASWVFAVISRIIGISATVNVNDINAVRVQLNSAVKARKRWVIASVITFAFALVAAAALPAHVAIVGNPRIGPTSVAWAAEGSFSLVANIQASVTGLSSGAAASLRIDGIDTQGRTQTLIAGSGYPDSSGQVAFTESIPVRITAFERLVILAWPSDTTAPNCAIDFAGTPSIGCTLVDIPERRVHAPTITAISASDGNVSATIEASYLTDFDRVVVTARSETSNAVLLETVLTPKADGTVSSTITFPIQSGELGPLLLEATTLSLSRSTAHRDKSNTSSDRSIGCKDSRTACTRLALPSSQTGVSSATLSYNDGVFSTGVTAFGSGHELPIEVGELRVGHTAPVVVAAGLLTPKADGTAEFNLTLPINAAKLSKMIVAVGHTAAACAAESSLRGCWSLVLSTASN